MPLRILIVDDQPLAPLGLRLLMEQHKDSYLREGESANENIRGASIR